ncbi:hypothetical protein DFJ74DRAFT_650571 [Hyaloraphidium curvatum]|nr:hypothetical protein DFJ74DRAFT_650571 [Hyaloraphidium curvatum]
MFSRSLICISSASRSASSSLTRFSRSAACSRLRVRERRAYSELRERRLMISATHLSLWTSVSWPTSLPYSATAVARSTRGGMLAASRADTGRSEPEPDGVGEPGSAGSAEAGARRGGLRGARGRGPGDGAGSGDAGDGSRGSPGSGAGAGCG